MDPTEKNQEKVISRLMPYKDQLKKMIDDNKVILFTGNAMELLGKQIDEQEALNVFNFTTVSTNKRYTGDVIVKNVCNTGVDVVATRKIK